MLRKVVNGILFVPRLIKYNIQKRRALRGHYGPERKWATELVLEEDTDFILAIQHLPDDELLEVGIISEDKEELRERTVDRFNSRDDEQVPEDFIR